MKTVNIGELLDKFNAGECSAEEEKLLEGWLHQYNMEGSTGLSDEYLFAAQVNMLEAIEAARFPKVKMVKLWLRIATVAAAVAAITLSVWFYTTRQPIVTQIDIAPGRNTATLTLSNGKTINLNGTKTGVILGANKLRYNDGTIVDPSSQGNMTNQSVEQTLTAATPRGGQYEFILPDGTQVWLNAASKISFPAQFSGATRKIFLSGEAYFQVTKNKAKPFIVESKGQEVTVLGTHFNINAYADESSIKTTLLEGSVKVSSLSGTSSLPGRTGNEQILTPNQQAINTGAGIKVTTIDPEEVIAWKNGLFMFDAEILSSIMKRVSRWYNIQVIYEDPDLGSQIFSGSVSKFDNISSLLRKLEMTAPVKFKIEGNKVIVNRK